MAWLGIEYDEKIYQSENFKRYDEVVSELKKEGLIYPCYETPEELEYKRKRLLAQKKPPIYDRSALKLTEEKKKEYEKEGRKPHWRFLLKDEDIIWTDLIRGTCHYKGSNLSDPVIIREDGTYLYLLPSTIDDADYHITHIIRGEDHVTNTAAQIQMFKAIGKEAPVFAHYPFMVGKGGQKLSKRLGSLSLQELKEQGIEPMAIVSFLAKIGTSDPIVPVYSYEDLVKDFDFKKFSKAQPQFDIEELQRFNLKFLHHMPYTIALKRFEEMGKEKILTEEFWETIQPNLSSFSDILLWEEICFGEIDNPITDKEEKEFLNTCAFLLPQEPWNENTLKLWVQSITEKISRKGKDLYHPLRLALTGKEDGPELKNLLPLMGKEKIQKRLNS